MEQGDQTRRLSVVHGAPVAAARCAIDGQVDAHKLIPSAAYLM
jgi:hypothetical protein